LRYREPESEEDEEYQQQVYPIGIPVDPKVAGLRYTSEIEQRKYILDKKFLQRNRILVADASKELPMGNIRDKKTVKLLRLRRSNMIFEMDAGLWDLAEQTMLANKADIQTSRAAGGFAAKLEVTQRREWIEKAKPEVKKGLFGRIIRGKEQEEGLGEMMEED